MFIILLDSYIFPLVCRISSVSVLILLNRGTYISCEHKTKREDRKKGKKTSLNRWLSFCGESIYQCIIKIKLNAIELRISPLKNMYIISIGIHNRTIINDLFTFLLLVEKKKICVNSFWKIFVFTFRLLFPFVFISFLSQIILFVS